METPKTSLEPGTEFQSFWVNRLIGKGGVGEVYEITHKGKLEAVKVIQAKWLGEEVLTRRMVDEGELLVRIKHPNVVEVHETGITPDGQVWIRMELLRGETLREVMNRRGLISVALACTYMRSAAHAAHQCHVIGAVHRDIKPENLFITNPDEIVKLLDFGIAKLYGTPDTADGQRHGTPLYMAPEQIRGHRVTPATDVYSLGLVASELLCGAHPFVDDPRAYDLYALYYKHFSEVPAPLTAIGIPKEISDVVAKALAKDPKERYRNGLEFAEALWGAWSVVRAREPGWDTEPGEPTKEELMERPEDGLSFGTGPADGRPSGPAEARPSRASRPSRISLVHRAVDRAKTELLPTVPRDTEDLVAFFQERTSKAPPAPRAETVRLPDAAGDPSCIGERERASLPAAPSIRLAAAVGLSAHARFVPVQPTVPLTVVRAEAAVPVRVDVAPPALVAVPVLVAAPALVTVPALVPGRLWSPPVATEPYAPPPHPDTTSSGAYPQTPPSEARAPSHPWAEVWDPASAGVRPVPGADVRIWNPRLAGTFELPEPLRAPALDAKAPRAWPHLPRLRPDRVFMLVAGISVALAVFFLWLHVVRARNASTSEPGRDRTARPPAPESEPLAMPAPPTGPVAPLLPATSAAPEPVRTASARSAGPTRPQANPTGIPKNPRPNGEVVDPWAR